MTTRFALGTYARQGGGAFVGLVLGSHVIDVAIAHAAYRGSSGKGPGPLSETTTLLGILEDWERNFDVLQAIAEFVSKEGPASAVFGGGVFDVAALRPLPPVLRPSKIINCAANYSAHLAEMRQYTLHGGNVDPAKVYKGDKENAEPYFFLKAPSTLSGAYDDIVLPALDYQIDWEAELGVVIGARGRNISAARSLDYVAGYTVFNDVSCRNRLWRDDRPNIRTDWLSSKSFDTFGPCGPVLVPRAFIPDHAVLRIQLRVNGQTMQDGVPGDMIYSTQEQIEYISKTMTVEPGDLFATGTLGGVGQGRGIFLKPNDIVETEIQDIGMLRNRVVGPAQQR